MADYENLTAHKTEGKLWAMGPQKKTVSTVILTFWCPNEIRETAKFIRRMFADLRISLSPSVGKILFGAFYGGWFKGLQKADDWAGSPPGAG